MDRRNFIKFTILAAGGTTGIGDFLLPPKRPRMVWVSVRIKDENQWAPVQAVYSCKLVTVEQLELLYQLRLKNRSMLT